MAFYVADENEVIQSHLPVAIVIDRSKSTRTIRKLINECSQQLIQSMKGSLILRDIVELLVIHYSSDCEIKVNFVPLAQVGVHDLDIQNCDGFTATGMALKQALARMDQKKVEWKVKSEPYYQPLLFLLTDGVPEAGRGAPPEAVQAVERTYAEAAREIRMREAEEKLVFIAAGIQQDNGERADMDRLRELSNHPERILSVSETNNEMINMDRFYNLIYKATNAVQQKTPITDVVRGFTNA